MHVFLAFKSILFHSALENSCFVCVHISVKYYVQLVTQTTTAQWSSLPLNGFSTSQRPAWGMRSCEGKFEHTKWEMLVSLCQSRLFLFMQSCSSESWLGNLYTTKSFPHALFIHLLLYRVSGCVNKWPILAMWLYKPDSSARYCKTFLVLE